MQEGDLENFVEKTTRRGWVRDGIVRHGFCGGFGKE
jgi:hypothetical protein